MYIRTRLAATFSNFPSPNELVRERKTSSAEFRALLRRAVQELEKMSEADRSRWLELLSYVVALVYHGREGNEHEELREEIERSVQTDEHRQEVRDMGQTIAEALMEEGRKEEAVAARQQTLLRLLRKRFGILPKKTAARIETSQDIRRLDAWLDKVLTAATLKDMGINEE